MNYLRLSVFALLVLLTAPLQLSWAGSVVVQEYARGTGGTEADALNNALKKAIVQVNGAEIRSKTSNSSAQVGVKTTADGSTESAQAFSFEKASSIELEANGLIDSYSVLGIRQENGVWVVEIEAGVYRYELDVSSQRKKIALLPVENNFSNSSAGRKLAMKVGQDIEAELVQTRRFAVLSRTDIDKVMGEQRFIFGDGVHKSERAKLGNLLGGDVLLSVTIEKGYISTKEKVIKLTGQVKRTTSGELKINAKVISAVTGEVKFSETYSNTFGGRLGNLDAMSKDIAAKSVRDLTNRIYPPLVISVNAGGVVLNIGGKGVKEDSVYTIYSKGQALVDPYTGESLGAVEHEVGKIKLIRVESKFSIGEVLAGGGFEPGMVARPFSEQNTVNTVQTKTEQNPETSESVGGVKLPFD